MGNKHRAWMVIGLVYGLVGPFLAFQAGLYGDGIFDGSPYRDVIATVSYPAYLPFLAVKSILNLPQIVIFAYLISPFLWAYILVKTAITFGR
jgi:hypothetical protein